MIIYDESYCEVDKPFEGAGILVRINAGTGVDRFEPTYGGKTHNKVKRKIHFLMLEERDKNKQTLFSFHTGMIVATNVIFTQIQATNGLKLFG